MRILRSQIGRRLEGRSVGGGCGHSPIEVEEATRSVRWMAVSCARRALHEGHTPRVLQGVALRLEDTAGSTIVNQSQFVVEAY